MLLEAHDVTKAFGSFKAVDAATVGLGICGSEDESKDA